MDASRWNFRAFSNHRSSIDLHAINVYCLFEMWCTQYTTDWVLSLDILLLEKYLKCKG